jgi:hypothetical protein
METRPLDTTESVWEVVRAGIERMTPAERVGRAISLTILAHAFALARIRRDHPDESDREHRLRLAARILPKETMRAAFDWQDD